MSESREDLGRPSSIPQPRSGSTQLIMNKCTKGGLSGCGCIYVAYGYEYLMMATYSATTIKRHTPNLAITLVTNVPVQKILHGGSSLFEKIIYEDVEQSSNRLSKLAINLHSPYEKTLYLDCDTEIEADISPMFGLLDTYEFAARPFPDGTPHMIEVFDGISAPELGLSMCNGGVFFVRKCHRTSEFFARWRENYHAMGFGTDQPSLGKTLYNMPELRFLPLSSYWNAWPWEYEFVRRPDVRIFHYREPATCPDVARKIWRTFRNLEIKLDLSLFRNEQHASESEMEKKRFITLYYWYAKLLLPFDSRRGRRWLFSQRKGYVKRFMTAFFRLRARLTGEPSAVTPYRDHKRIGPSARVRER